MLWIVAVNHSDQHAFNAVFDPKKTPIIRTFSKQT